ncbi:MAG: hypothetical protein ACREQ5_04410 [Candidatus Dormibacteria bacterium]
MPYVSDVPLIGCQTPRISNVPSYASTVSAEAIELAAMVKTPMDPWQQLVLHGALGQDVYGRWTAPEVGLVVPRQQGKTVVVLIAMLSAVYLHKFAVVYTAHLMATSRKIRVAVQNMIESNPDLDREVKQIRTANEEQSIELKSGARMDFVARSGSSARGWSGDIVILDEAFALAIEHVGALMPIMFARGNWQLWYLSMAGKIGSHALRRIRQRALDGDRGLAYYEWSVPEDVYNAAPDYVGNMPAALAQANPALGLRVRPQTLFLAQRSMDPVEYGREVLGVWDDAQGVPVIDLSLWGRLVDVDSQIDGGMVFALDASPGLVSGAIGVAGYRGDGLPHVEITARDGVLDHRPGVDWMVARAAELDEAWHPVWVMDANGPARALLEDLRAVGIEPELIIARDLAQACGALLAMASVIDKLRHLGQQCLTDAIKVAKKRDVGDGAWAWGRRVTEADICTLYVVTLALHGLAVYGAERYDVLESVR